MPVSQGRLLTHISILADISYSWLMSLNKFCFCTCRYIFKTEQHNCTQSRCRPRRGGLSPKPIQRPSRVLIIDWEDTKADVKDSGLRSPLRWCLYGPVFLLHVLLCVAGWQVYFWSILSFVLTPTMSILLLLPSSTAVVANNSRLKDISIKLLINRSRFNDLPHIHEE